MRSCLASGAITANPHLKDYYGTYICISKVDAQPNQSLQSLKMPSETDPLLPRGNTAPEISGYGFSRPSESRYQIQNEALDYPEDIEDKSEQRVPPSYGDISPLRTILALFIVVVSLAMFVALLIPGAWNPPWNKAPKDDAVTVKARVDQILAETPLIGPPIFSFVIVLARVLTAGSEYVFPSP